MSDVLNMTVKELTKRKRQRVAEAIQVVGSAEDPTPVANLIYSDLLDKPEKLRKSIDMETYEDVLDTVESYIAISENALIKQGYLGRYRALMVRERIKLKKMGRIA